MIPRFNSKLSLYPLYRNTCRAARKHPRVSLAAAAAAAAAAIAAAGASADPGTWSEAFGNAAMAVAGPLVPAGQAGTSSFDSVIGLKGFAAAAEPWQTRSQTGKAQLDSRNARGLGGAAAAARGAGHAAQGAKAGSGNGAAGNAAQLPGHAQPPAVQAQAAQHQLAHDTTARNGNAARAHAAPPRAARPRAVRRPAAPARPYLIYDSVTPTAIPAHRRIATYANGAYAASAAAVAGRGPVLWIDTNGSDPAASVLDVEPGDATPAGAARWVRQKLSSQPRSVAIVYTMRSEWQAVKDNVATLPRWMRHRARYWIADPTGVPHVVAGANATQWYWGKSYDITTANPGFQV